MGSGSVTPASPKSRVAPDPFGDQFILLIAAVAFPILKEKSEKKTIILIDNSMILQQVIEFYLGIHRRRCNNYYPGAKVDDITAAMGDASVEVSNDSVLRIGANDVTKISSENC